MKYFINFNYSKRSLKRMSEHFSFQRGVFFFVILQELLSRLRRPDQSVRAESLPSGERREDMLLGLRGRPLQRRRRPRRRARRQPQWQPFVIGVVRMRRRRRRAHFDCRHRLGAEHLLWRRCDAGVSLALVPNFIHDLREANQFTTGLN